MVPAEIRARLSGVRVVLGDDLARSGETAGESGGVGPQRGERVRVYAVQRAVHRVYGTTMKPILVGESNPFSYDPEMALYPWPRGSSGSRIAHMLGMSDDEYLAAFDRMNLMSNSSRWSVVSARAAADEIIKSHNNRTLLLLGSKVASAFWLGNMVVYQAYKFERSFSGETSHASFAAMRLPHPSGRSRIWNDPTEKDRFKSNLLSLLKFSFSASPIVVP